MQIPNSIQIERVRSTLAIQFPGIDLDTVLGELAVTISRKTDRVRGVFDRKTEERLFSLRTSDGRYVPTFQGGRRLLSSGYEGNRVVMNDDAAPFIARGKSAFCKHVVRCDDNVVPYSEVLLVDEANELLAVGTSHQPGYAMLVLDTGIAARVKHARDRQ